MNNNTELILIRITGLDRPGLTASITEILSKYDVTILDIGQADIHSTLSLGILFKSQEKDSGNIMKELLFKASALGINIRFYPVTVEEYEEWVNMQGKNRYILTLLGRKLTAKQIAAVTGILAEQRWSAEPKPLPIPISCGPQGWGRSLWLWDVTSTIPILPTCRSLI